MRLFKLISFYLTFSERCLAYSTAKRAPVAANLAHIFGEQFKHVFRSGDGGCNTVLSGKEREVQNGVAEAFYLAKVSAGLMELTENEIRKSYGSESDASKPDPRISGILKTIMGLDLGNEAQTFPNGRVLFNLQFAYTKLSELASTDLNPLSHWTLACARNITKTSPSGKTDQNPTFVNGLVRENPVKVITNFFSFSSQPKYPIDGAYYFSGLRAYWRTSMVRNGPCYGQNTLALPLSKMKMSTGKELAPYMNSVFVLCPSWNVRLSRPELTNWFEYPLVTVMKSGAEQLSIESFVGLSSVFFKGLMRMANPHLKDYHHSFPTVYVDGFAGCQAFKKRGRSGPSTPDAVQEDVNCLYYLALVLALGVDVDEKGMVISHKEQNSEIAKKQLDEFGKIM